MGEIYKVNLRRYHSSLFRYTLAGKRNSSQDSRIGERQPTQRGNNLQSGVILKVPSAGSSAKPEDSNTYRDSCQQQQRKNGSIYGTSPRGKYLEIAI